MINRSLLLTALSLVLFFPSLLVSQLSAGPKEMAVGVAKIDITPAYAIRLSGYGDRTTESEGVHQRIWAKALALGSDGDGPVVLITVDNCGVPATLTAEVARRLSKKANIGRERLAICCSHTHCAPMLSGVLPMMFGRAIPADQQKRIDRYTGELTDKIEQVALAALKDRRPSRLAWDIGKANFAINRRGLRQARTIPNPIAPVDHRLPVLRVTDSQGKVRAIFVRYACHATTVFGVFNKICGDWPGYAQEAIQRDHPGAIAMVAIGCGADSKPNLQNKIAHAKTHGEEIAREVNRLLKRNQFQAIEGPLTTRLEKIELPFAPLPSREDWLKASKDKYRAAAYHAKVHLERLDRGEKLPSWLPYEVQSWTFSDDLTMVFLPGEVVVDYAIRLGRELDGSRLWVNGYANDVPCYIASKRVLQEGGYEADRSMYYYGRPTRLADEVEELIVDSVLRITPVAMHRNAKFDQPAKAKKADLKSELPHVEAIQPSDAIGTFRVPPDFRLELLAAEPLVTDPVAIKYDENNRAYVAEMGDYPYSDKSLDTPYQEQKSLPLGRIRILEDTDNDGRFDKSTIFADKLSWPTGLALYKGGVFVTATPDIWYLKDTDGDGKADIRRKVFTGFRKYNVQAVINNLQWGLDHRIYGAGSSNGGNIQSVDEPTAKPVRMGRGDFRFDPQGKSFEILAGGARFGNTFDDWGNRFICNIRNPVQHIVLENRYLARNPYLPVRTGVQDASDAGEVKIFRSSPSEPWRIISAQRKAADPDSASPISEKIATGYVTSCSGITIYRGDAYPQQYYGNAFVGEVAGNLVMRYSFEKQGPTFVASRKHGKLEFLTSTDNWFRPTNFVNAPDGTLHMVDMYRETIEHPWSIPDDIKEKLDLRSGTDRGRIYRIAPVIYRNGFKKPPIPRLGSASVEQLVAELENPNAWWRETAHRLLFERQDIAAVAPLQRLLRDSNKPTARLHALWSLEGLGRLSDQHIADALSDPSPQIRSHAIRLAESRLGKSAQLQSLVLATADDKDVQVRYQAALSIGEMQNDRAAAAIARIARQDGADRWTRTALLSSLTKSAAPFLLDGLADKKFASGSTGRVMIGQLAYVVGARNQGDEVHQVLTAVAHFPSDVNSRQTQLDVVLGVGAGLKRSGNNLTQVTSESGSSDGRFIAQMLADAGKIAANIKEKIERRQDAIRLLGYGSFDSAQKILPTLLDFRQPQQIQSAAVAVLSSFSDPKVGSLLLKQYSSFTPTVRKQVVAAMLSRGERILLLLDAVEQRKVSSRLISPVRRLFLMQSSNIQVSRRAKKLFSRDLPGPRNEVVADYQSALSLPQDTERGEVVYKRECLNCHRLGKEGHDVGPNLATIRHRSQAEVLVYILDPNREVSPNFLDYVVVTEDGRIFNGIIAAETATSLTLRLAENKEQTILRQDIDTITSSGKSLMPEGLEKKIKPQEMADLLQFLLRANP